MFRRIGLILEGEDVPFVNHHPVMSSTASCVFGTLLLAETGWLAWVMICAILWVAGVNLGQLYLGDAFVFLRGFLIVLGIEGLILGPIRGLMMVRRGKLATA